MARSRVVNTNPYAMPLADGSYVACGAMLLSPDGKRDRMLYGTRGTHALYSEAEAASLIA